MFKLNGWLTTIGASAGVAAAGVLAIGGGSAALHHTSLLSPSTAIPVAAQASPAPTADQRQEDRALENEVHDRGVDANEVDDRGAREPEIGDDRLSPSGNSGPSVNSGPSISSGQGGNSGPSGADDGGGSGRGGHDDPSGHK